MSSGRGASVATSDALDFLGFDLNDLLPRDGGLACMLKAYFDESQRPDGTFCVAGFVFTKGQAARFQSEWKEMLTCGRIFHMVEVVHRNRQFKHLRGREASQRLQDQAVEIIAKYAQFGVAVACNLTEIEPYLPKVRGFNRAYPLCAHFCLAAVGAHLDKDKRTDVVSYLFEQGNEGPQGDADALMHLVRRDATLRRAYHYHSHAFVGKQDSTVLQAADLLAWEYGRFKGEHLDSGKEPSRPEFRNLIMGKRIKFKAQHLTPRSRILREYFAQIQAYGEKINSDLDSEIS